MSDASLTPSRRESAAEAKSMPGSRGRTEQRTRRYLDTLAPIDAQMRSNLRGDRSEVEENKQMVGLLHHTESSLKGGRSDHSFFGNRSGDGGFGLGVSLSAGSPGWLAGQ
jgi:hypothetical protein